MIRPVRLSDAPALHILNRQELGYDIAPEKTQQQLAKLMADP